LPDDADEVDAAHAGHVDVADDDVEAPIAQLVDRLLAVGGHLGRVAELAQHAAVAAAHAGIIVEEEDGAAHGSLPANPRVPPRVTRWKRSAQARGGFGTALSTSQRDSGGNQRLTL